MRTILVATLLILFAITLRIYVFPYTSSGQYDIKPDSLSGLFSPDEKTAEFHGTYVDIPEYTPTFASLIDPKQRDVLGTSINPNKRIEVDLTNQRLYAYEGNTKVYEFPVSTGLWGKTPTGEFRIWVKLRYTRMEGGNKAWGTYYNLPNVPYTMFFANDEVPASRGFGIHGAYWHNNFGRPMSHGCINMKTADVEKLYYWADPDLKGMPSTHTTKDNPGTKVIIYGTAPNF
jgi:lipoprotein-anchoring transpeptidase ErfK/SrfK